MRVIREEFNNEYRGVIIDDQALYEDVRDYVANGMQQKAVEFVKKGGEIYQPSSGSGTESP